MPASIYVYYRVAQGCEPLAQQRVDALLERVKTGTGVRGRLLKKRGDSNLWMEVYEGAAGDTGLEATLEAEVGELAFDDVLMQGWSRRIECFED